MDDFETMKCSSLFKKNMTPQIRLFVKVRNTPTDSISGCTRTCIDEINSIESDDEKIEIRHIFYEKSNYVQ